MGAGLNRDTAVGIVGAIVLVAAMAGVFFYERSQFSTYEIDWQTQEAGTESDDGSLDEGSSEEHLFTADAEGLSTVRVTLTWTDDVGQPDTFEVTVQGPDGTTSEPVEGASSPLEVEVPIHEAPESTTATGRSLEDARDQANASASWTDGTGDWTVTVTLVDAPGEQTPIGGQETTADGSQDYDITFTYERWAPSLTTDRGA